MMRSHTDPKPHEQMISDETELHSRRAHEHPHTSFLNTEFLQSLGTCRVEDLSSVRQDEPLTEAQIDAFWAVFECFNKNSDGYIDAESLRSTLDIVGMFISSEEAHKALRRADTDEDGVVGFYDFLSVMTDCQQFSNCVKTECTDREDVSEQVFYKTLAKFLKAGILPYWAAGELVQYYHKKTLHVIQHTVQPDDDDDGHVLLCYSKVAHLLGLNYKQLMKYMMPPATNISQKSSPGQKAEHGHMGMSLHRGVQRRMARIKITKTQKTVEIEDWMPKLSIKHPGEETKYMITPVQIKMNLGLKERDCLTYDKIKQIVSKAQSGLNQYLKTLTQYKRRDSWRSWDTLQSYCRLHHSTRFPEIFCTYSWSWSSCQNMMEVSELLQRQGLQPRPYRVPFCAKQRPHISTRLRATEKHQKEQNDDTHPTGENSSSLDSGCRCLLEHSTTF
ncbi:EF-hand calcium-binding domain-containing protein 3-like isoform X2 [Hoplias malabaricus]